MIYDAISDGGVWTNRFLETTGETQITLVNDFSYDKASLFALNYLFSVTLRPHAMKQLCMVTELKRDDN